MIKKMMLLALSACALVAFAVPAAASAAISLSDPAGTLEPGAEVTATSHNLVTNSPLLGELKCEEVVLHGEVTENGPTSIHIFETAKPDTIVCNHEITEAEGGTITISEGGTGKSTGARFVVEGLCEFASAELPFTYETNTDVLEVAGAEQFSGPCGPATMTGSFTLETPNGEPVTIT